MSVSEDPNQMLCYCLGVRYGTVEEAIVEKQLTKVAQITQHTKAGGGCRSCHPDLKDLLARVKAAEEDGRAEPTERQGLGAKLKRLFGRSDS